MPMKVCSFSNILDAHLIVRTCSPYSLLSLRINDNTGKVLTRSLDLDILGLFLYHKGIYIGRSQSGVDYVAHTTASTGTTLICMKDFLSGKALKRISVPRFCNQDGIAVAEEALRHCIKDEPFYLITNNCLVFISKSCAKTKNV